MSVNLLDFNAKSLAGFCNEIGEKPFRARQLLRWIILPLIKPVLLVVALTRALTSLKVFDIVFVLTSGGPGRATETLSYNIYIDAFQRFDFGHSAALSWILIMLAMLLSIPLVRAMLRSDVA